jgi:hypothetical protein
MYRAPLVKSHDDPCMTQHIVRPASVIAKDSLAQPRGTEAFHSAFSSGVMATKIGYRLRSIGTDRILNKTSVPDRVKISRTLPARPDGVTPSIIEERDVQRLMYIADPMS